MTFFWTLDGSIAIKWPLFTSSLRFGGWGIKVFQFGPARRKTVRTEVIYGSFQPNYHPPLLRSKKISRKIFFLLRIWAVTENDLAGLHLWIWRDLWTLPWNQLCLCRRDSLLVLHQALQELFIKFLHKRQSFSVKLDTHLIEVTSDKHLLLKFNIS